MSTVPSGRKDGFSSDSNIRRLLNAPARRTSESLCKTEGESPAKDEGTTIETCKSPEQAAEVPTVSTEILDPTPAIIAPAKNAAIRCLLDLPRLDQRQTAKTDEAASSITPMPRHDPSDSPMMTQLKLHLAYAFHKLARNALATNTGSSSS
ncbi:hypothetical protein TELCIR_06392 [Teladorsagia circumcincta]|uniref:Uncharacterized protein n=1 Tax=Teladorsagia circumcincta TaxID=45464 RepID=A0A2G9UQF2_TELCI|nr:hypothetical protein TELCIR_06392 [Teladorsagia circumcincta]